MRREDGKTIVSCVHDSLSICALYLAASFQWDEDVLGAMVNKDVKPMAQEEIFHIEKVVPVRILSATSYKTLYNKVYHTLYQRV